MYLNKKKVGDAFKRQMEVFQKDMRVSQVAQW